MAFMLPVVVKVFTGDRAPLGAQLALDAKLYNPKWLLKVELRDIANRFAAYRYLSKQPSLSKRLAKTYIAIAYYQNVPVGVVLKAPKFCMAYTCPGFRRMGVGRQLVESVPIAGGESSFPGIKGSIVFWEKMGFSRVNE